MKTTEWKKTGPMMQPPVPKSELRGDAKHNTGHHGTAKGRRKNAPNGATVIPASLDKDPAGNTTKPWANAPAAPASTDGHEDWARAKGYYTDPMEKQPKSGELNQSSPNNGMKSWKSKNYSMVGDGTALPIDSKLAKKWAK